MSDVQSVTTGDPLHEQRELAERLAGLIADGDEQRSVLAFGALMNLVDGFAAGSEVEGAVLCGRHACVVRC